MRLEINKEICESCNAACLENCPNKLMLKHMGCRHCHPEKAACAIACERNAIIECAKGILRIEGKKCNACGKCVQACAYDAISIIGNKAAKCDLCYSKGFQIECIKNCRNSAIKIARSLEEIKKVEELLGWNLKEVNAKRVVKTGEDFEIIQDSNGEKIYCIKEILPLSGEEAGILNQFIKGYRAMPAHNAGQFVRRSAEMNNIELNENQIENFTMIIEAESSSFGIIKALMKNESLEEIACIGTGKEKEILVYHNVFGWLKTNLYFSSEDFARELINKMGRVSGRRLSLKNPVLNAVLENGDRLNASINPVAYSGLNFTIRRFRQNPFTPLDLINLKTLSAESLAFLWIALQAAGSILICGNTGSGKTTTVNALFGFLPKDERTIMVEETPEINIPQKHAIRLKTSDNVSMQSLITETLRMRPDRVIVGEIRSAKEVSAFIDTMLAGQGKGSFATFHAQSADECLSRLNALGIDKGYLESIDLIIVQKRWDKIDIERGIKQDLRRVVEISEVSGNKTKAIFKYDHKKDLLLWKGSGKKMLSKIGNCYSLGKNGINKEITLRAKLLERIRNESFTVGQLCKFCNNFERDMQFRGGILEKYGLS